MRTAVVITLVAIGCIAFTSCTTDSPTTSAATSATTTTSSTREAECVAPPQTEIDRLSPVALTVEPNPVPAGDRATLAMSGEGLSSDAITGAGVIWQCWNGSSWITTDYQIVRGFNGEPSTELLAPGVETTIPAIALPVPNDYAILIPPVAPGHYRIVDGAAFIVVEVT